MHASGQTHEGEPPRQALRRPSAEAHLVVARSPLPVKIAPSVLTPAQLVFLQKQAGNGSVERLLRATWARMASPVIQRCGDTPCACSDEERADKQAAAAGPSVQRSTLRTEASNGLVVMRLSEGQFQTKLGATPQQRSAVDRLFSDPTFQSLWSYLRACRAVPRQDVGPLALEVTPGLRIGGVERFGGYDPVARKLEINPTKPEHQTNPTELVDTVIHELIHAVDDLQADCVAAGSPPAPLGGAATATLPSRASVAGTPDEARLTREQGPGASDPCGEFIDINAAAQDMIVRILQSNVQTASVGRPTLTFLNVIIRRNPVALTTYETCRSAACLALPGPARDATLNRCAADTIARFIPADLQSALLPARIHFDIGASVLRADDVPTADMLGLFLVAHPAVSVRLVGHTDPTGSVAVNRRLGVQRAERIRALLLAAGVPRGQILSVESREGRERLSTSVATHWMDRRVEVLP
jgi:outer membrane protein OmpA-like peptidoglycan-associated protein